MPGAGNALLARELAEEARAALSRGDMAGAQAAAREALRQFPSDPSLLHLAAVVALETHEPRQAVMYLEKALKRLPGEPALWCNLGTAQKALDRIPIAERSYRKALALDPDHPETLSNLADLVLWLGRPVEAELLAGRAIAREPDNVRSWLTLGEARAQTGEMPGAAEAWEQAFRMAPARPDAGVNAALAWAAAGEATRAESGLRLVLRAVPGYGPALRALCGILVDLGQLGEAAEIAEAALAALGRAPDALVLNTQGRIAQAQGRWADARALYERALELGAQRADVLGNLAALALAEGDTERALTVCREARDAAPDDPRHAWQASLIHLARGELAEGWALHEAGFACGQRRPDRRKPLARWAGEAMPTVAGPLILWREQGIGDEIRLSGLYAEAAARAGGDVVIACAPRLAGLFARSFPGLRVVPETEFDSLARTAGAQCPAGALPAILRRELEDFDRLAPGWLTPDPERVAAMQAALEPLGPGPRIGLNWTSGMTGPGRDVWLSLLADLAPVLALPGACFVSLAYAQAAAEEIAAARGQGLPVPHVVPGLDLKDDLDGAAALAHALDLVIDIGVSVGDMAAAVGTQLWSVHRGLAYVTLGTDRLPFLPGARLIRHGAVTPWPAIWADVAEALQIWMKDRPA